MFSITCSGIRCDMDENIKDEEILRLQSENRHLKETVTALREAMEKQRAECEDRIQKLLSEADDEAAQLKAAINALRDEMERIRNRYEEKLQELESSAGDEIKQLRETITVLRERLEEQHENRH